MEYPCFHPKKCTISVKLAPKRHSQLEKAKKNRMGRLENGLSMRFFLELEMGLEPTTYWLRINCATNCATLAYSIVYSPAAGLRYFPTKLRPVPELIWLCKSLMRSNTELTGNSTDHHPDPCRCMRLLFALAGGSVGLRRWLYNITAHFSRYFFKMAE